MVRLGDKLDGISHCSFSFYVCCFMLWFTSIAFLVGWLTSLMMMMMVTTNEPNDNWVARNEKQRKQREIERKDSLHICIENGDVAYIQFSVQFRKKVYLNECTNGFFNSFKNIMFSNETLCMWTYIYEATEPIPILMIMAMYSLMCACMTAGFFVVVVVKFVFLYGREKMK